MPIQQVIKYEGDNSTFVWKHPAEDFNTNSQLIVHESQEAVFFMNGQALDLFGSGRYTLETQNIPLLNRFINISTGGESAFHCEVYFINKTVQMAIPWGTDSKIQYIDSKYGFPISIGAGGEMSLKVDDSKKLLVKIVGTEKILSRERLMSYFRAFLMARVKAYLAKVMKESKISIFEVDEHINEFSEEIRKCLIPDFDEYGITLEKFFVTRIVKPEGDMQYEKFKELYFRQYADIAEANLKQKVDIIEQNTETQKIIIEAQGIAQKRSIEGYTYQQERGFDVAEKVAMNEGVGEFNSAGIGLGIMAGIGGTVSNSVGTMFNNAIGGVASDVTQDVMFCDNCGNKIILGAEFCDECGQAILKSQHKCLKCGYIFERPGKFCPKCGNRREN